MMRKIIFLLIGAGLVMTGYSQALLDEPVTPAESQIDAEPSGMDLGMDQIKPIRPGVNIFTNATDSLTKEELSVAEKMKQSKVGFLLLTGSEYSGEGEYEEAERAYLRALEEADHENPEILSRLAVLYVQMERMDDAAQIFKKLLDQHPENPMIRNNLAWCYAKKPGVKNTALALRHAREALLSAPVTPSIWNTLAECYYAAGDYDKARRSAEYALELLQRTNPDKELVQDYWAQREKIIRAQKARDILEGRSKEE